MPKTTSENILVTKTNKYKKQIERKLSEHSKMHLQEWMGRVFDNFENAPNLSQLSDMIVATRFGTDNAILAGGDKFFKEYVLKDLNAALADTAHRSQEIIDQGGPNSELAVHTSDIEMFANVVFRHVLDARLAIHAPTLSLDQFTSEHPFDPNILLDKDTRAFGVLMIPGPSLTPEQSLEVGLRSLDKDVPTLGPLRIPFWEEHGKFKRPIVYDFNHSFPAGKYVSEIDVVFGTIDRLVQLCPDRDKHDVSEHERLLRSGRKVSVRSHKRSNPLRSLESRDGVTDHVVYIAKDADGRVRYVGEGKPDRPSHVNSGRSHNAKINEHFFLRGRMDVTIIAEGLTKSEALAIEKMVLQRNDATGLWNVRDYEGNQDRFAA